MNKISLTITEMVAMLLIMILISMSVAIGALYDSNANKIKTTDDLLYKCFSNYDRTALINVTSINYGPNGPEEVVYEGIDIEYGTNDLFKNRTRSLDPKEPDYFKKKYGLEINCTVYETLKNIINSNCNKK